MVVVLVALVTLTGCFPHRTGDGGRETSGFFMGIWHGWIAPISLIVGFFKDDIRIYDPVNTGWLYDLGFTMAVISGFGGIARSRRSRNHDH